MRLALIQTKQNALYQFLNPDVRYTLEEAAALQRDMLEQNLGLMRQAADGGCDLMVTTEAINFPGHPHKVQGDIAPLVDESLRWLVPELSAIAKAGACYIAACLYSRRTPEDTGGGLYNALWLFDRQGEVCVVYHKTHLAGDENDYLVPGDRYCVAETDFGRLGLAICWDMQFPETCQILTEMGADLIVTPTWGWEWIYGPARAYENGVHVAAAMAVPEWGPIEGLRSPSEVIRPDGECIARGSCTEAQVIRCEIPDLKAYQELRELRLKGRRSDLKG